MKPRQIETKVNESRGSTGAYRINGLHMTDATVTLENATLRDRADRRAFRFLPPSPLSLLYVGYMWLGLVRR